MASPNVAPAVYVVASAGSEVGAEFDLRKTRYPSAPGALTDAKDPVREVAAKFENVNNVGWAVGNVANEFPSSGGELVRYLVVLPDPL